MIVNSLSLGDILLFYRNFQEHLYTPGGKSCRASGYIQDRIENVQKKLRLSRTKDKKPKSQSSNTTETCPNKLAVPNAAEIYPNRVTISGEINWRLPPSLNELTTIIFNMELTHLGLEAPN